MFDCATVADYIKRQDIPGDWQFLPVRHWYLIARFAANVLGLLLLEAFFVFAGLGFALQRVPGTIVILIILLVIMVLIVRASWLSLRVQYFDCIYWRDEYIVFVPDGILLSTRSLPKHVRCLPFAQIQDMELVHITRLAVVARGGNV